MIETSDGTTVDGFEFHLGDSDSGSDTVDLPPGAYVLDCDVPGHRAAGMEADLRVD